MVIGDIKPSVERNKSDRRNRSVEKKAFLTALGEQYGTDILNRKQGRCLLKYRLKAVSTAG